MDSQKKDRLRQKSKVESIFELIHENVADAAAEFTPDTDIKFLKTDEEEWLKTVVKEGEYDGIRTGYEGIDILTGSFLPGELFTIGGDTGHGKSLLAINIAQNVYKSRLEPVMVVNLELTESQLRKRFYELSGDDRDYAGIVTQVSSQVNYKDIDIIMQKAKVEGCCLVIIDHLHFFNDAIGDNQAAALTRIVKHFKECAVQHELPVILLSHVTPTTKQNGETIKPDLHNFKGSRSIEQISDMVGFVWRDTSDPNNVEFYTRKNRSRPLNKQSTHLIQHGWRLTEDKQWLPTKLEQL